MVTTPMTKCNNSNLMSHINVPFCFIYVIIFAFLWTLGFSSYAQYSVPRDEQYKKRPTNAIASIAQGNTEQAISNLKSYIQDFQDDAESYYCLVMAYASKKNIELAMQNVELAMENGLPLERIFAGPQELARNLIESKDFRKFAKGRYSRLIHGPMLGDVTATGAKIWLRTEKESMIIIKILDEETGKIDEFDSKTLSQYDNTATIQIQNLKPSTRYKYEVYIDGSRMFENGIFKTIEINDKRGKFKIGFGGGAGYTPWQERMWDTLAAQSFHAFLLLGDNVYIDYPEVPAAQKYCYYRRQSRPEFRRFTSNVPIYAIWDDHDFTVNDGEGGPDIDSPAWKRPVWNVFKNQWPNPYYGGGHEHPGCWFDFSIADVDFIMLDCRYYRENPKEVDTPSMLGAYQKTWLKEKLKTSTGTFKVIASSVPWAKNTKPGSDDTWDGFSTEREEIFSFITENKIEGVLLLSADRHRSDAWKVELTKGYTTYDLMSSRLTNIHTHKLMPGSLFGYNKKCSFGTLEFDTMSEDPSVTYLIKSIDNEEIHKMTIYRSQLDYEAENVKIKRGRN